jgi:uncharacterized protein YjbJ (UPF0337 family)
MRFQPEKERKMNNDIMQGKWERVKGAVQKNWGKLTNDELDVIDGDRKKLMGAIQESYGIEKEEAERQIKLWEKQNKDLFETH